MKFVLGIVFLLVSTVAANAQSSVQIRAAEHPDYSRLVVPLGQDVSWVQSGEGRKVLITFPGLRTKFALDDVFARMPRTRIVAVVAKDTTLGSAVELTLNCSCKITTARIGSRFLAIDVSRDENSGVASASRRLINPYSEAEVDVIETTPPVIPVSDHGVAPQIEAEGVRTTPPNADFVDMPTQAGGDVNSPAVEQSGVSAQAELVVSADSPEAIRPPLAEIRDDLENQLSSAASEGLLDLAERHSGADPIATDEETFEIDDLESKEAGETTEDLIETALLHSQIKMRSALDNSARMAPANRDQKRCVSDSALNVARWTSGHPLAVELGVLRREIVTEYGSVDTRAVADLAKLYIINGFGREARDVLSLVSAEHRDNALLRELALVVEARALPENSILAGADECEGRISMWRAVAGLEALDQETERGAAILAAFSELPPELRRIAGDGIASTALQSGDEHAASVVIGILDRTPGSPTPEERLMRAEHAIKTGDGDQGDTMLHELALESDSHRLSTLLVRADEIIARSSDVPDHLVDDLTIELRQVQGTEIGLEALQKTAKLKSMAGDIFDALHLLEMAGHEHPEAAEALTETTLEILQDLDPDTLPDADYARLILDSADMLGTDQASANVRQKFARSLLDRGLPNVSLAILTGPETLDVAAVRILKAETLLMLDRPLETLETLGDLPQEKAARLRSQAHVRLGSLDNAFLSLASLSSNDPERSKLAALSRNWQEVDVSALPVTLQGFVGVVSHETDDEDDFHARDANVRQSETTGDQPSLRGIKDKLDAATELRGSTLRLIAE